MAEGRMPRVAIGCHCNDDKNPFTGLYSRAFLARRLLKTLHLEKHILAEEECERVGEAGARWWDELALTVAVKPPGVVQQTLDVLEEYKKEEWYENIVDGIKGMHRGHQGWLQLSEEDEGGCTELQVPTQSAGGGSDPQDTATVNAALSDLTLLSELHLEPAHVETPDEAILQQLCLMATAIKQLTITPNGGTFTLGRGDASLEFPRGAVVKEISIRYAIILHGPFICPAGYKPGSIIVYLNMEGVTLVKPVQLDICHWCSKEDEEDSLCIIQAVHTLDIQQQKYLFEEREEGDLSSQPNKGIITISEPNCLYCVQTKVSSTARYSAITFSKFIPPENTLLFRIQVTCDSREWNEKLKNTLKQKKWESTDTHDAVTWFEYADNQHQITATLEQMSGAGWVATVEGQQAIPDKHFLLPLGISKEDLEMEVISGRYPPCFICKILYTGAEENRVKDALLKVHMDGANVPVVFNCRVKEEMSTKPHACLVCCEPHPFIIPSRTPPAPATTGDGPHPSLTLTALQPYALQLARQLLPLGIVLGIPDYAMAVQSEGGSGEDKCLRVLQRWIDVTPEPTWEVFHHKLRRPGLDMHHLAITIAQQHCPHVLHT